MAAPGAAPASRQVLWDRSPLAAPIEVGALQYDILLPAATLRYVALHVGVAGPPARLAAVWDSAAGALTAGVVGALGCDATVESPLLPALSVARVGGGGSGAPATAASASYTVTLLPPLHAPSFTAVQLRLPRLSTPPPPGAGWGFLVMDATRRLAPLPPAPPTVRALGLPVVGCWVAPAIETAPLPTGIQCRGAAWADALLPDPRIGAVVANFLAACPPDLRGTPAAAAATGRDTFLLHMVAPHPALDGALYELRLHPPPRLPSAPPSLSVTLRCVPPADTASGSARMHLGAVLAADAGPFGTATDAPSAGLLWRPRLPPLLPVAAPPVTPPSLPAPPPPLPPSLPSSPAPPPSSAGAFATRPAAASRGDLLAPYLLRLDAALEPDVPAPVLPAADSSAAAASMRIAMPEAWELHPDPFVPPAVTPPPPSSSFTPWLPPSVYEQMAVRDGLLPPPSGGSDEDAAALRPAPPCVSGGSSRGHAAAACLAPVLADNAAAGAHRKW